MLFMFVIKYALSCLKVNMSLTLTSDLLVPTRYLLLLVPTIRHRKYSPYISYWLIKYLKNYIPDCTCPISLKFIFICPLNPSRVSISVNVWFFVLIESMLYEKCVVSIIQL